MSIWAKEPQLMANMRRRRVALTKALIAAGFDPKKLTSYKAAGPGEAVAVKFKGRRLPVFFLTYRGLCEIAKQLCVEVPR